MAKKKKSRASRKTNRKGAAGKAKSASTTSSEHTNDKKEGSMSGNEGNAGKVKSPSTNSERVHSEQDSMSGNEILRPIQIDESLSLFLQTVIPNANDWIQSQESLGSKEQKQLLREIYAIYDKDLLEWVETLFLMMATGELYSLGSYMSLVFAELAILMELAIMASKKDDVLIDGLHLYTAVNLMCSLMHAIDSDEDKVLNLLKSLTNTVKGVNDVHYSSSVAAYVLCHSMIKCYFHIREKKRDDAKPLMMIARSGILEQVLLHIHLSWSPPIDEQALVDEYNGLVLEFFGILIAHTSVLHKIFKEGTGCHNALNAIVQDRIRPCKENEHIIGLLKSLKKISDLSNCKLVNKQRDTDEAIIDIASHSCAKCNTVDLERPLLVCARCKSVGYCSKKCQVADWKKHKVECLKHLNKDMNTPVKNVTR